MKKRKLDIVVISDVHLGTRECHADELLTYLSSVQPKILVLNGDILEVQRHKESFFPPIHSKILRKIITLSMKGTEVYYITGNHDDAMRRFSGLALGNLKIVDKLVLNLNGKKTWFFHGDIFDISIKNTKWLTKLGGYGYVLLFAANKTFNWSLKKIGREKYSLSKKIRDNAHKSLQYTANFERSVAEVAIENDYDYVVCGHIHQPKKIVYETNKGACTYLNSGDWVENLTALEYSLKRWKVYRYNHDKLSPFFMDEELKNMNIQDLIDSIADTAERREREGEPPLP
ncbi:UDP-2,3-diacylglucosamine pyrophosphatase LpxH [Zobellia uliginosa]|uniref:UDP-2,3-diacylglucosamine pyrophosphatase LpxH n=1 Tax=Zobellia uliginosa TaxID=143224 RepID=A0ABY1KS08_9FLAO|nr:UDP-2,3-diacylglucosamine diphosphatase [Zobellia uliginosa]SIS70480.1 UDP-2,3-diacylglucosamine pyrophosphatase LpxH [Zobellia uliginosa]